MSCTDLTWESVLNIFLVVAVESSWRRMVQSDRKEQTMLSTHMLTHNQDLLQNA